MPLPSPDLLVVQSNAEVLFVKDEQWISTSAAPIKLTAKDKKLDGMLSAPTTQWFMGESKDDQTHVLSYRSPDGMLQKQLSKLVITDAGGKVVGLVKHGDVKNFERGLGRAVLYASTPPSGGGGHATVTEGDVTLHAAYEIRVPDDAAALYPVKGFSYAYSKAWYQKDGGIGAFAAGANGAFSAQPAFKLVLVDKCQMMDKFTLSNATGELVATIQSTQASQIGQKREVTVAPGVEVVLPVVFASIVRDFFNRSPLNG